MAEDSSGSRPAPVKPLVAGAVAFAWLAVMLALVATGSPFPRALGIRVINLIGVCIFAAVWAGLHFLGRHGASDG